MSEHIVADNSANVASELETLLIRRVAEIEVSVFEANGFVGRGIILNRERRGVRVRKNFERLCDKLDLSGSDFRVDRRFVAKSERAFDREHILASDRFGFVKDFFARNRRVEHDLKYSAAVAEIDENKSAEVAAFCRPTGNYEFLTYLTLAHFSAIIGAFEVS